MAGTQGFEPRYAAPEAAVLPLDDVLTAAAGDHEAKVSDLNILSVLSEITPRELGASEDIFRCWREKDPPQHFPDYAQWQCEVAAVARLAGCAQGVEAFWIPSLARPWQGCFRQPRRQPVTTT